LTVSVAVHVAGAFAVVAEKEGCGSGVAVGAAWCCHGGGCRVVLSGGGVAEWCCSVVLEVLWEKTRRFRKLFMFSLSRPVSVAALPEIPQALRNTSLVAEN
jgi:hypothetical protein